MSSDVLVVCTGNVCRSPAAERLLAARTGLAVRSAGTRAAVGSPVSPEMAELLADGGIGTAGFAARQLEERHLGRPRLVIALTREHRSAIVELEPTALNRTFTLTELARLTANLPAATVEKIRETPGTRARVSALAKAANTARATAALEARDPAADDIIDPIGRPANVYAEVHRQIKAAVATIARVLG